MSNKHAVKEAPASYKSTLRPLVNRDIQNLISGNPLTENLNLWISATKAKSTRGRGSNNKTELVGIKKLRELILELAVRGKLVPQNPEDEPASELLKKIDAEKAKLLAKGKIKKQKKLPEISADEKPFVLPNGWEWSRLQTISIYIQRGKGPKYSEAGSTRVISQKCIQWNGFDITQARFIQDETISAYTEERFLQTDDLAWNSTGTGTVGRITSISNVESSLVADSHVTVIRPLKIQSKFIEVFISTPTIQSRMSPEHEKPLVSGTTNQVELNTSTVNTITIPIPPLTEQHRIVEKVDELMALCDQLEQHSEHQHDAHKQLVETLLATLVESENADDLATNWQRLAEHFDTMFSGALTSTTGIGNGGGEWAIDRLKDTILQLAVMGKLVPQNPDDEPASELLKKIETEKAKLVKEGKIKKQKPLPEITDEEKPFELPDGWEWCHLLDVSIAVGTGPFGSMINKAEYIDDGVPLINPSHMINDQIKEDRSISVSHSKAKELDSYVLTKGDLVLARRGEVGRCALVTAREDGWLCGTGSFYLRLSTPIFRSYTLLIFKVSSTRNYLTGNAVGTTMVNLNHTILNSLPIALPPEYEQHRIVAKVDELFALCDQLKAHLQAASETQLTLTEALVKQALN